MEILHHDSLNFLQLGPFVDSEHPQIKKGTTDSSFDEIFHLEILRRVLLLFIRDKAWLCFFNHCNFFVSFFSVARLCRVYGF